MPIGFSTCTFGEIPGSSNELYPNMLTITKKEIAILRIPNISSFLSFINIS